MNKLSQIAMAFNELPIVQNVAQKQQQVAALRPLSAELEGRIMQKLRLEWNYHSNAIEGNSMSYGETVTYLMYGLTAKGKTLKDHLDIRGHNEAIFLLLNMVKEKRGFSEADIRNLHKIILVESYYSDAITPDGKPTKKLIKLGQYKEQPNHVITPTGEMHYYATPENVPILMAELMDWYNAEKDNDNIQPFVLAAIFHHRFVAIHPFDDGNGRLGRILMNLILMQKGLPPAIIKLKDRADYYLALNNANAGDYQSLVEYMGASLNDSLDIYLRAADGERVEEIGDIDKELSLFVRGFGDNKAVLLERSNEVVFNVLQNSIFPFLEVLMRKLETLAPLFSSKSINLQLNGRQNAIDNNGSNLIAVLTKYKETDEKRDFEMVVFTYKLSGFSKGEKPFDYKFELFFHFNLMQYELSFWGLPVQSYAYSQLINQTERLEIVEKIMKLVMQQIQSKNATSV
jgi:Fic family protein